MERQIKSERTRRSTVLQADGRRECAIIRSRGEAARMVLTAEVRAIARCSCCVLAAWLTSPLLSPPRCFPQCQGARAADVLRAEGHAAAKKMMAEAEAASLADIKRAVASSGVRAVDYLTAVKYLEMMGGMSRGHSKSRAVLLPSDAVNAVPELMRLNAASS